MSTSNFNLRGIPSDVMIFLKKEAKKLDVSVNTLLDFLLNLIRLLKLFFLASRIPNFSGMLANMLSKFWSRSTQKDSIFPIKASFAKSLLLKIIEQGIGFKRKKILHHDLDHLAGSWTVSEEKQFNENIQPFEQIDKELWN